MYQTICNHIFVAFYILGYFEKNTNAHFPPSLLAMDVCERASYIIETFFSLKLLLQLYQIK
jgi:hypothetical protein